MARRKSEDKIQVISNVDESIREVTSYDLVKSAYLEYGSYINNWRQLPQILDGFKISYRRLLYSALQFPPGKMIKSANLLGKMMECFTGDTEVVTDDWSLMRIDKLYEYYQMDGHSDVRTYSISPNGIMMFSSIIKGVYEKGLRSDIVKVNLSNGESFKCTSDHPIMTRNGEYVEAKNLEEGTSLMVPHTFVYKMVSVKSVEVIETEPTMVYDLEVSNQFHNFLLKAGVFVHNCHPHSTDGSYNIVCSFSKSGIFDMQGFGGCRSIDGSDSPAAAPRYTEVKVSDKYLKLLGRLIKKVPYVESPIGNPEPTYIPTPLPFSLFCSDSSVSGLGLGISTDIPNFSPRSMYQAYMNNDPNLLEPNINIVLNKGKSDLRGIWENGRGRVTYEYVTSRIKGPDGNPGILIEGDAGIFTPNLKRIRDWQAEGKVYVEDMITQDGAKLAIYKVPNIKSLSIDDLEAEVRKACVNNMTYSLNISDGGSAFRIPLKEWIKATYNNYISLVTSDNEDCIREVEFDILVATYMEQVANYVINVNPKADDEEIAEKCGTTTNVVAAIMSRSISNLRKTKSQTEKIKQLNQKLKELKKFNAVSFTEDIIDRL